MLAWLMSTRDSGGGIDFALGADCGGAAGEAEAADEEADWEARPAENAG